MKNNYTLNQKLAFYKGYHAKAYFKSGFLFLLFNIIMLVAGSEVFGQTTYGDRTGTSADGYVINNDNSNNATFLRLQNYNNKAWRLNNYDGSLVFTYSTSGDHADIGANRFGMNSDGTFKFYDLNGNSKHIIIPEAGGTSFWSYNGYTKNYFNSTYSLIRGDHGSTNEVFKIDDGERVRILSNKFTIGSNTNSNFPFVIGDNTNYFTLIPNSDAAHLFTNKAFSYYVGTSAENQKMVINSTGVNVNGNIQSSINITANKSNTPGKGFELSDDGDIVDNNNGYATMRFSHGIRISEGKNIDGYKIELNSDGKITASSFIKTGGVAAQFLKADGSLDGNTYLTTSNGKSRLNQFTIGTNTNSNFPLVIGDDTNYFTLIPNSDGAHLFTNKAFAYYVGTDAENQKMVIHPTGVNVNGNINATGNTASATLVVGTPANLAANTVATFGGHVQITPAGATPTSFNTTYGDDYLLWVEKGIVTNDVAYAEVAEWADFVFDQKYELMPIQKVAQYIDDNGHLPNIPSAAEVKKDGFTAVDMTKKLLQKIEELTLYSIAQDKKIEALSKAVEQLQNK